MSARSFHQKALLLKARATCPRVARHPSMPSFLCRLLAWICRPRGNLRLDAFSDHMLRDIGIDPDSRENSSGIGFWR
jgi:uncharacterized protein YjiS (DUF1127 family)